ncbi:MAG: hypothetical protein DRN08_05355, partial [Thermoplasmata archaeon]
FYYDSDGLFLRKKKNVNNVIEWVKNYNDFGLLKNITDANGARIEYTYDSFGRTQMIQWDDQDEGDFYVLYNYYDFRIPRAVEVVEKIYGSEYKREKYFYDGLGRLVEVQRRKNLENVPPGYGSKEDWGVEECPSAGIVYFGSSDCNGGCTADGCQCISFPGNLNGYAVSYCTRAGRTIGQFANYYDLFEENSNYYGISPRNAVGNPYFLSLIVSQGTGLLQEPAPVLSRVYAKNIYIKTGDPGVPSWVADDLCKTGDYFSPDTFSFVETIPDQAENCYVTQIPYSGLYLHYVDCCEPGQIFNPSTGECEYDNGGGGLNFDVTLQADPSEGTAPLQNVDLIAHVQDTNGDLAVMEPDITYKFDCEYDGMYEFEVTLPYSSDNLIYHAQGICSYDEGVYNPRVSVLIEGIQRSATTVVYARPETPPSFCENSCNPYNYPQCDEDGNLILCINTDDDTCYEEYVLTSGCSPSETIVSYISYNEFGLKKNESKPVLSSSPYGEYIDPSMEWSNVDTVEYTYDGLKRQVSVKNYDDTSVRYEYGVSMDDHLEWKKVVDENGHATTYYYDAYNRLVKVKDATGNETTYEYDALGNLIKTNLPSGGVIRKWFNSLGQLTAEEHPDTGISRFWYDENGNIKYSIDAVGNVKTFDYDVLDRVVEVHYANKNNTHYYYDCCENGVGRLCGVEYEGGSVEFSYDNRGRITDVTKTIDGESYTFSYEYYDSDMLRSTTDVFDKQLFYSYDVLGRLRNVDYSGLDLFSFTYYPSSTLQSIEYGNGDTNDYYYDVRDRLTALVSYDKQNNLLFTEHYVYDYVGNIVGVSDESYGMNLSYDALNRLKTVFDKGYLGFNRAEIFGYDELGNRKYVVPFDAKHNDQ